jgi:shikimate kinase
MKAIYLLGFRASGKTSLGRALAEKLQWDFFDSDEIWESRAGKTIHEFVEGSGIEAFRREEESVLRELVAAKENRVIATGGGWADWPASVDLLARAPGEKIYLEVPAEELWRRLENAPERRKIGDLRSLAAMAELLKKRAPNYEKIATSRVASRDITRALERLVEIANRL